ncbi:septation ring formation regulator EzrA [Lactobacillus alvi]|uniref:Septation ring formation regulator EzrA n=1 Tax=Limosilactobacillus alvi TaxID=990412 RepID=A0ABS2EQY2_9LACO|nr:septation ring formation regulator EzrA [Limosilactobacillus alvi]MBM6754810.1 septation ring formation regulator EzrA [Limosilactobacillus alvi]
MVQILIIILVIALLVIVGLFVYQRQTLKKLSTYGQSIQAIPLQKIDQRLSKEKVQTLMGESLKTFTDLRQQFDKKLVPNVKKMQHQIELLSQEAKTTALFTIAGSVSTLAEEVASLLDETKKIETALDKLDASVKNQTEALTKLRQTYNQFSRQLDDEGFSYGESKVKLNQQLIDLQKKFEHFAEVANQGDHQAAQEILDELRTETQNYEKLLKTVPELYRPLYTTFPDQLAELSSGYEELKKKNYNFTEANLPDQIKDLSGEQKFALEKLTELEIGPVKGAVDHLAPAIDHLYDVMQKELDARPQVKKLFPKTKTHLEHAESQNRQLLNELDKLSISYTLNHNEIADARGLSEQLRQQRSTLETDEAGLNDHSAIESQVLTHLEKTENELTAIEKQQQEINQSVATLREDEERAQRALQRFAVDLKTTKRRVENLNLPGIPQDYLDYFFVVSNEVKKLSQLMNQPQIDMEEITKQLLVVQSDLGTLRERTTSLRDSAELTERLIQYAHRLSVDHEEIEKAIEEAQTLFSEYKYAESLETLGTAVEEAEPGSFKRLEDSYYQEVEEPK